MPAVFWFKGVCKMNKMHESNHTKWNVAAPRWKARRDSKGPWHRGHLVPERVEKALEYLRSFTFGKSRPKIMIDGVRIVFTLCPTDSIWSVRRSNSFILSLLPKRPPASTTKALDNDCRKRLLTSHRCARNGPFSFYT